MAGGWIALIEANEAVMRPAAMASPSPAASPAGVPRTADGKPDLQGIWQARTRAADGLEDHRAASGIVAGRSVVEGKTIRTSPGRRSSKRTTSRCAAPRIPWRTATCQGFHAIMYMDFPFQIFQTSDRVAITFEWSALFRLIYTSGAAPKGLNFWMGDSRGHWEGDVLVVDVTDLNDRTWFDKAGDFHSDELRLVERYTMKSADLIDLHRDDHRSQSLYTPLDRECPTVSPAEN